MSRLYVKISDETKSYSLADTVSGVPYLAVADEKKIPIVTNTHDGINLLCREGRVAEYRTWLTTARYASKLSSTSSFTTTYVTGTTELPAGTGATITVGRHYYVYRYTSGTYFSTIVMTGTRISLNTGYVQSLGSFIKMTIGPTCSYTAKSSSKSNGGTLWTQSTTATNYNDWVLVNSLYPDEDTDWDAVKAISKYIAKYRISATVLLSAGDYAVDGINAFDVSSRKKSSTWTTVTYENISIDLKKLTKSITTQFTATLQAYSGISGGYL